MPVILRDYQREAVESAWDFLCTQPGNPVICLPTGSGKTPVASALCRKAVEHGGRVLVISIRKELLSQNHESLKRMLPDVSVGLYSAGLNERDTESSVIVCGIASVYKRAGEFGSIQLLVVDECQYVGDDESSMFLRFISELRALCPRLRAIGLSATPFRLGTGSVCGPTKVFQDICYTANLATLIADGYLSPLVMVPSKNTQNASGVSIRQGEYVTSELAALFDDSAKIEAACREIHEETMDRKSVLIFGVNVAHAEHIQAKLDEVTGEEVGLVTGEMPSLERATLLRRFREGDLRFVVNVNVLSVGFDHPGIDAVCVMRATASSGLWAQIVGRVLRIFSGKLNAKVLDFGGNAERHGPLDAEDYGLKPKSKSDGTGDAPTKNCPACQELCPASARECECGWRFPAPKLAHESTATGGALLQKDIKPQHWSVISASLSRHKGKEGKQDTLRADYTCQPLNGGPITYICPTCGVEGEHIRSEVSAGRYHAVLLHCESCEELVAQLPKHGNLSERIVSEWVCVEHTGFAGTKARQWWAARSKAPFPNSIDDALDLWQRGAVALSSSISIVPDGKYTRIVEQVVDEKPEEWAEVVESIAGEWSMTEEVPF